MPCQPPPLRPLAAVVGSADPSPALAAAAEAIGCGLVDAGMRVATGGLGGVMEAASRGAHQAEDYTEGRVIGLLPGLDARAANPWVDVVLPTGMHHARNVLLVAMADVVIAIGGAAGTLSEIALAWAHGVPVVALDLDGGWSARLAGRRLDHRGIEAIRRATSPAQAVRIATEITGSARRSPPRSEPPAPG